MALFITDHLVDGYQKIFVPPALVLGKRETDEPVTSDIKRLIRMPHTLHGKTGLAVVPMNRAALDGFVPLRDAVPKAWTEESVKASLRAGIKLTMRDETFNLKEGLNLLPDPVDSVRNQGQPAVPDDQNVHGRGKGHCGGCPRARDHLVRPSH